MLPNGQTFDDALLHVTSRKWETDTSARRTSAILCTPVWGVEYIRVFCDLVLSSLLAPDNLPAFAWHFDCRFLIYTNRESRPLLAAYETFDKLQALMPVDILLIEDIGDRGKYDTLTACYNDAIKISADRQSALVFLNADMIYSDGTFAAIAKRAAEGKRCVEIDGFRTKKQGMEHALRQSFGAIIAIRPAHLVSLALEHIHSITLSHFWEPEGDGGFIPFHTYWRAGKHGVVGKLSHLYPLYLYPRDWNIGAAKTIDWDLIERAGLFESDIHIVTDSDELFVTELSDENYAIAPTFPNGGSIAGMREFIVNSCSSHHVACLTHSSRLKADQGGDLVWRWAELKASVWLKAVRDRSLPNAIALRLLELPARLSRVRDRISLYATMLMRALRDCEAISKSPHLLSFITHSDPGQYLTMFKAAPGLLQPIFHKSRIPIPFSQKALAKLNASYEAICLTDDGLLPLAPSVDLLLARDPYFGTGWRLPRSFPARQIGADGSASIYVRLKQNRAYNVTVIIAKIQFELGRYLQMSINGKPAKRQRIECTDTWKVRGIISPALLEEHSGAIKLSVGLSSTVGRKPDVFVSRIQITPMVSVQESVFAQAGLCSALYSTFSDPEYRQVFNACPKTAELDSEEARAWIADLDSILSERILPGAAAMAEPNSQLVLGDTILGHGWSPPSAWGSQTFRYLAGRSASIFIPISIVADHRIKVYVYECPSALLKTLSLEVDGDISLPQGLQWETDRYFLWVNVPASSIAKGFINLTIRTAAMAPDDSIAFSRVLITPN